MAVDNGNEAKATMAKFSLASWLSPVGQFDYCIRCGSDSAWSAGRDGMLELLEPFSLPLFMAGAPLACGSFAACCWLPRWVVQDVIATLNTATKVNPISGFIGTPFVLAE